jgi:uncharacterized protein YbaR (Trm112 family)
MDADLRAILVCPVDKAPLRDAPNALVCTACGRRYPIEDGIPVLLPETPPQDTPSVDA